jgi:rRNA maturation endonuclease Nob1
VSLKRCAYCCKIVEPTPEGKCPHCGSKTFDVVYEPKEKKDA